MEPSRREFFCIPLILLVSGLGQAAEPPDLGRIERRIAKEPAYQSKQPLYALYLFGPEAKTRVWAVLDKSRPDGADYDVLYFDRNADGDLTGEGERIKGKNQDWQVTFDIGNFTDPVSGQQHEQVVISYLPRCGGTVLLSMLWCGRLSVRGGFAPQPGLFTRFAANPADAPVLWPSADGPMSFQILGVEPLGIGTREELRVLLGHQGIGLNTFCAVSDCFLPNHVPVRALLIYRDKEGKEKRSQWELRERC
jgi:hypothetical protein